MKKMKDYEYHYAIQGRLYPSLKQKSTIKRYGGSARFVYNRLVAINNEIYLLKKVLLYVSFIVERIVYLKESISSAKNIRNSAPFLYDINIDVINNAIKNYNTAWENHKKRHTGIPTYHKKSEDYSYGVNPHYNKDSIAMNDCSGCYIVDKNHVVIAGLGVIRVKFSPKMIKALLSRTAETRLGTFTVSHDATDKYYVSIQLASDIPFVEPYEKTNKEAGIDLNLRNFLTDSDGHEIENLKPLKKAEKHLKKQQRNLSKKADRAKKEGRKLSESKNYQKQKLKVAKIHKHISNQREDLHQRAAVYELKTHDAVYAEDLKVKNMLKNHNLAKAISDTGWRSFLILMQEKANLRGKKFELVPPRNTTQTCHSCGYVLTDGEQIDLTVEHWDCPNCGEHHRRDHNAAINVLNKGLKMYP